MVANNDTDDGVEAATLRLFTLEAYDDSTEYGDAQTIEELGVGEGDTLYDKLSITFVTRYGTVANYNIVPTIDKGDAYHTQFYELMSTQLNPDDPSSIVFDEPIALKGSYTSTGGHVTSWNAADLASGSTLSEELTYSLILHTGQEAEREYLLADSILDLREAILEIVRYGAHPIEDLDDVRLTYNEEDTEDSLTLVDYYDPADDVATIELKRKINI